ncbi:hypothetical protein TM239_16100 [Bradyrhizobium sp. TM239]|nr:hypothetical protein TM239_16100 [Bradyrhizobium sp. TM239]
MLASLASITASIVVFAAPRARTSCVAASTMRARVAAPRAVFGTEVFGIEVLGIEVLGNAVTFLFMAVTVLDREKAGK